MKNYIQLEIPFEEEEWRDIEGYEGLYQVSNLGRVKSIKRVIYKNDGTIQTLREKILKPQTSKDGYLRIILCKNGKGKSHFVHRLVALAFVPNVDPEHKTEANHINEIKIDCRASNINWLSRKENINWGTCISRAIQKKNKPVKQLTLGGVLVAVWPSIKDAGKNGFNRNHICECCSGRRKTASGYKWKYV